MVTNMCIRTKTVFYVSMKRSTVKVTLTLDGLRFSTNDEGKNDWSPGSYLERCVLIDYSLRLIILKVHLYVGKDL